MLGIASAGKPPSKNTRSYGKSMIEERIASAGKSAEIPKQHPKQKHSLLQKADNSGTKE